MKKHIPIIILAAGAFGFAACDTTNVPEAVTAQFQQLYPTAEGVEWEQEGTDFEAEFTISAREREALFTAEGTLIQYSEEIEEQYLPGTVQQFLQERYANYKIDEIDRLQEGHKTYYEVELADQDNTTLLFDESGTLMEQPVTGTVGSPATQQASLATTETPSSATTMPKPDASWELPSELREVSGIALLEDDVMACVQDEDGIIFLYDLNKKAVIRQINFGEAGDYEGIAIVDNTAFVLRSDGSLFEVSPLREGKARTTLHKSTLPETLDTEGLAYDKANNRLLIAPKGYDKNLDKQKGLYAFSLADKKWQQEPAILISLEQEELVTAAKKNKDPYDVLQPSSLEIRESTGEIYVLDAENYLLLSIDEKGVVQKRISLDKDQLRQPEGFTFDQAGNLYIASEGSKKGNGVILKFKGF